MGCFCRVVVCARWGAPGLGSEYLPSACEWIVCWRGSMCWARARWGSWSLFWWDLERRSITGPADRNGIKSRAKAFLGLISGSSQLIYFYVWKSRKPQRWVLPFGLRLCKLINKCFKQGGQVLYKLVLVGLTWKGVCMLEEFWDVLMAELGHPEMTLRGWQGIETQLLTNGHVVWQRCTLCHEPIICFLFTKSELVAVPWEP